MNEGRYSEGQKNAASISHEERLVRQEDILNDLATGDPFDKDLLKGICAKHKVTQAYLYMYPEIREKVMGLRDRRIALIIYEYNTMKLTQSEIAKKHNTTEMTIRRLMRFGGLADNLRGVTSGHIVHGQATFAPTQASTPIAPTVKGLPNSVMRNEKNVHWGKLFGHGNMSFRAMISGNIIKDKASMLSFVESKCDEYGLNDNDRYNLLHNAESIWYTMLARLGKAVKKGKIIVKTGKVNDMVNEKKSKWKSWKGSIRWAPFLGYSKKESIKTLIMSGVLKSKADLLNKVKRKCEEYGIIRQRKLLRKASYVWMASTSEIANGKLSTQADRNRKLRMHYMKPKIEVIKEDITLGEPFDVFAYKEHASPDSQAESQNTDRRMDSDEVIILKLQENINMYKFKRITAKDVVARMKELVQ